MLEYDSEFSDASLKKIVDTQKIQRVAKLQSDDLDEYFSMLSTEVPPLSKGDQSAASVIEADRDFEGFGFDALQTLSKTYTIPTRSTLDLDNLLKSATDSGQRLTLELMKVNREKDKNFTKTTGTVSDEMQSFYEWYQHLFSPAMKSAIQMSIKCLDFPLFLKLMSSGLKAA